MILLTELFQMNRTDMVIYDLDENVPFDDNMDTESSNFERYDFVRSSRAIIELSNYSPGFNIIGTRWKDPFNSN